MSEKPILIYKLTPTQIDLVDRLASCGDGISLESLSFSELIALQELEKLGVAGMRVRGRGKINLTLTELGTKARANRYLMRKPVLRLTAPQIAALRFLAGGRRHFNGIPAYMKDVCRRMLLRGWAISEEDDEGQFWMRITSDGWNVLKLVDLTESGD